MNITELPHVLLSRIGEPNEEGCRPWLGHIERGGYGRVTTKEFPFSPDGRIVKLDAHRIIWELVHEHPIPDGMWLDHDCHQLALANGTCQHGECRHRRCVEPAHLFPEPRDVARKALSKYGNVRLGSYEDLADLVLCLDLFEGAEHILEIEGITV